MALGKKQLKVLKKCCAGYVPIDFWQIFPISYMFPIKRYLTNFFPWKNILETSRYTASTADLLQTYGFKLNAALRSNACWNASVIPAAFHPDKIIFLPFHNLRNCTPFPWWRHGTVLMLTT